MGGGKSYEGWGSDDIIILISCPDFGTDWGQDLGSVLQDWCQIVSRKGLVEGRVDKWGVCHSFRVGFSGVQLVVSDRGQGIGDRWY